MHFIATFKEKVKKRFGKKTMLTVGLALFSTCCLGLWELQSFDESHVVDWSSIYRYARLAQAPYLADSSVIALAKELEYDTVIIRDVAEFEDRYAVFIKDSTYLVATRGTANKDNAIADARVLKKPSEKLGIFLHRGFAWSSASIYEGVKEIAANKTFSMEFTGHSLGGAEAMILAMYFSADGRKVNKIITFGQPKVMDEEGVEKYGHLPLTRIINRQDIVPLVPGLLGIISGLRDSSSSAIYKHTGRAIILLDSVYYSYIEKQDVESILGLVAGSLTANLVNDGKLKLKMITEDLPDHFMENYLSNIKDNIGNAEEVPYKEHGKFIAKQ